MGEAGERLEPGPLTPEAAIPPGFRYWVIEEEEEEAAEEGGTPPAPEGFDMDGLKEEVRHEMRSGSTH